MKKIVLAFIFQFIIISCFSQIQWISFESAMEKSAKDGKPVLIDVYTDWCGWCKRLDQTTYADTSVINYINTHFYAVKLNAETMNPIKYRDSVYVNKTTNTEGKKQPHDLAIKLLYGKMSYPTTIFMLDSKDLIAPIPGYLTKETIQPYLFYFGEQVYMLNNTWESFYKGFTAPKF